MWLQFDAVGMMWLTLWLIFRSILWLSVCSFISAYTHTHLFIVCRCIQYNNIVLWSSFLLSPACVVQCCVFRLSKIACIWLLKMYFVLSSPNIESESQWSQPTDRATGEKKLPTQTIASIDIRRHQQWRRWRRKANYWIAHYYLTSTIHLHRVLVAQWHKNVRRKGRISYFSFTTVKHI